MMNIHPSRDHTYVYVYIRLHACRLRVVAKWVDKPEASALDSRTVFILQAPDIIYIWVGKDCDVPEYFIAMAYKQVC